VLTVAARVMRRASVGGEAGSFAYTSSCGAKKKEISMAAFSSGPPLRGAAESRLASPSGGFDRFAAFTLGYPPFAPSALSTAPAFRSGEPARGAILPF
jgi:hypothetical protein